MANIDPLSSISPHANIHPSAVIGPFCHIEAGVIVEKGCHIKSHVVLRRGTQIEENVTIDSFSTIGGLPQDIGFNTKLDSYVSIGANTVIREGVTIHRSKLEGKTTIIKENCYLMTQCHIGHDCVVGPYAIVTNNVLLAGHVEVGAHANVGGATSIHQFVRIGPYAMAGGFSGFGKDIPPFCLAAKRNQLIGLNLVGLRRHGFSSSSIQDIKNCYSLLFGTVGTPYAQKAQQLIDNKVPQTKEGILFLEFFIHSKRGCLNPNRNS